jgi:hypothetical protein
MPAILSPEISLRQRDNLPKFKERGELHRMQMWLDAGLLIAGYSGMVPTLGGYAIC